MGRQWRKIMQKIREFEKTDPLTFRGVLEQIQLDGEGGLYLCVRTENPQTVATKLKTFEGKILEFKAKGGDSTRA